jgi:hypothetical protein
VVLNACQRRLTTPDRLRDALARRPKIAWRRPLVALLTEAEDGVHSPLELAYHRDVERAHGLPAARRNRPEGVPGRRRYRDVRYPRYATIVELDGRVAHPPERRHHDRARDNDAAELGQTTLRFGWHEVTGEPCETAARTGRVLRQRGWDGAVRRCGPSCRAVTLEAA